MEHHDPVKLLRATAHSKKAVKEKRDRVVTVSYCKIAIGLSSGADFLNTSVANAVEPKLLGDLELGSGSCKVRADQNGLGSLLP